MTSMAGSTVTKELASRRMWRDATFFGSGRPTGSARRVLDIVYAARALSLVWARVLWGRGGEGGEEAELVVVSWPPSLRCSSARRDLACGWPWISMPVWLWRGKKPGMFRPAGTRPRSGHMLLFRNF